MEVIDSYHLWDQNSDRLLVWFGGSLEPYISQKMAIATQCDLLTIKNIRRDWYVDGIYGIDGGYDGAVEWLKSQVTLTKYNKIYFGGQSSGGYAALRMAHNLKPNAVFAFNPTTQNFRTEDKIFSPPFDLVNLNELYENDPVDFPIIISNGRSENGQDYRCDDLEHSRRLKKLDNVTSVQHPYDVHPITKSLKNDRRFYSFVAAMISVYG